MLSLLLLSLIGAPAVAEVRITNRHLVAACVAGKPVDATTRKWKLGEPTSFTLTMRNEPRSGVGNAVPGFAVIDVTPEAGHVYEIEVRADASTFSRRVWSTGEWKPVVRDRTTDRIVSGDPRWITGGCR